MKKIKYSSFVSLFCFRCNLSEYASLGEQNVTFIRLILRAWHVDRATGMRWFIQPVAI